MHIQCPLGNVRLDLLRWTPISGAPFAQDPRSSRHRLSCVKDTFMPHHRAFVDVDESTRPFEEAGMEPENSLSMAASTESERSWASGCAGGCLAPPVLEVPTIYHSYGPLVRILRELLPPSSSGPHRVAGALRLGLGRLKATPSFRAPRSRQRRLPREPAESKS